jgi:phosphoribosylglycinamide formyltransferase-1
LLPIAVLVSGSGTNLQAIIDAWVSDPDFGAGPVVVISDRPRVGALDRAFRAGIPTEVVDWADHPSREAFTKTLCDVAESHGAEALVMAGFMRILAPDAVTRFPDRILNIHPALLPAFPGPHPVPDALHYGVKVTGVTVHFVDEEVDHGPIIAQRTVEVQPDDTPESLHARIQVVEHRLYPEVIKAFAHGRLRVAGREVVWV